MAINNVLPPLDHILFNNIHVLDWLVCHHFGKLRKVANFEYYVTILILHIFCTILPFWVAIFIRECISSPFFEDFFPFACHFWITRSILHKSHILKINWVYLFEVEVIWTIDNLSLSLVQPKSAIDFFHLRCTLDGIIHVPERCELLMREL